MDKIGYKMDISKKIAFQPTIFQDIIQKLGVIENHIKKLGIKQKVFPFLKRNNFTSTTPL